MSFGKRAMKKRKKIRIWTENGIFFVRVFRSVIVYSGVLQFLITAIKMLPLYSDMNTSDT
jgi:hypothetical protein